MNKVLKKIYVFLFREHDVGFIRFCYAMLIPCALSDTICRAWMLFMSFILALATHTRTKCWNEGDVHDA